ncbi:MAG: hypothetical protein RBT65_08845 [Methanolobus sp.]|jgi:hypothetical protein|nr:hypothetical protein [Methanolobus sp.]
MVIKEEIFNDFFEKLSNEESFPKITIEELKELYANNSLNSKDDIFAAIEKGVLK